MLQTVGLHKPIVMGFMPYWLLGKTEQGTLAELNQVTYFGLVINSDGTIVQKNNPQETEPGWHSLNTDKFKDAIKDQGFPKTDTSLLLHLVDEASISALIVQPTEHAITLVQEVEPIMKEHGFGDLNLDIESFRRASPEDRANMTTFLRTVKSQLDEKKLGTLTVELTTSTLVRKHVMVPEDIAEIADRVVLMAYDFHYPGSFISGANAPLGGAGDKFDNDVMRSVQLAAQVIPREKIILGIPLYGNEWETLSYSPESPVIPGTGKIALSSRVEELLAKCAAGEIENCVEGRDEVSGSPYLILPPNETSSIQQIYYEDAESIKRKLDLAEKENLGGVAFWAIGYENEGLLSNLKVYRNRVF